MRVLPIRILDETAIVSAVADVERLFAPMVVRILYEVGHNWMDEDSVFFRVVLSDDVGDTGKEIRKVGEAVERALEDRLDLGAFGLRTYFNYRLLSEQAVLKEKSWA